MAKEEDRFVVGYALVQKKQQSFVQPSLVELARQRGVDLVCIDASKALVEQGPFDAILHKLSGQEWHRELQDYAEKQPGVIIIDSPDAIERLHNRISMLQAVSDLRLGEGKETFGIPKQAVVDRAEALQDVKVMMSGLKFPVIAKPLVADGSAKSHAMSLIFNREGLSRIKPPLVLQEFVNHGGVIFKVYVVGDYVKCVRRRSLPDVREEELHSRSDHQQPLVMTFSQISNMPSSQQCGASDYLHAELPPSRLVTQIARGLRDNLGLRLFNFDLIRDSKVGNHYHVIDINYFPGYAKMPAYESVLVDFFLSLAKLKLSNTANSNSSSNSNNNSNSSKVKQTTTTTTASASSGAAAAAAGEVKADPSAAVAN